MSPVGKEMHYKNGMKKDPDGFTDIDWCSSAVLNSWDDLRKAFMAANARKAIAPTQARTGAGEGGRLTRTGVSFMVVLVLAPFKPYKRRTCNCGRRRGAKENGQKNVANQHKLRCKPILHTDLIHCAILSPAPVRPPEQWRGEHGEVGWWEMG